MVAAAPRRALVALLLPCEQGKEKPGPPSAERRQNGVAGTTTAPVRKPVRWRFGYGRVLQGDF
jgi:hypothetical protein